MKLLVRSQHLLGPQERTVRLRVFCPAQRRSVDYDECRVCPRVSTVPLTPGEPGACIDCAPPETAPGAPSPPSLDACAPAGRDEPIGALARPSVLCVHAELPLERLQMAFREGSGFELPVVDGLGHLLGIVWRDDFVRVRRLGDLSPAPSWPQRVVDRIDQATTLRESSSIEHAVEVFTSKHVRTLVLVGDDDTVAGVLTDLDLLRWLAQKRRRLSEM